MNFVAHDSFARLFFFLNQGQGLIWKFDCREICFPVSHSCWQGSITFGQLHREARSELPLGLSYCLSSSSQSLPSKFYQYHQEWKSTEEMKASILHGLIPLGLTYSRRNKSPGHTTFKECGPNKGINTKLWRQLKDILESLLYWPLNSILKLCLDSMLLCKEIVGEMEDWYKFCTCISVWRFLST